MAWAGCKPDTTSDRLRSGCWCSSRSSIRDGTRDSVLSDESWKATQSPILASEIYNGENYDARLEQKGWDQPSFSDARWGAVVAAAVASGSAGGSGFPADSGQRNPQAEDCHKSQARSLRLRSRPEHGRMGAAARFRQGRNQGSNPLWRSSQAERRALHRKFADGRGHGYIHLARKGN